MGEGSLVAATDTSVSTKFDGFLNSFGTQPAMCNLADPLGFTSPQLADIPASFKSYTEQAHGGLQGHGNMTTLLKLLLTQDVPER